MSPAQRAKFYFPAWNTASQALGWRNSGGRIIGARQDCWTSPKFNELYQRIWDVAEQSAQAGARALTSDDFRHACHVVALGRDKSSNDMTNNDLDRVVSLFTLLAHPDELRAVMAWSSPEEARRKRITWWIRHNCVASYVVAVCREKFGSDEMAALTFSQLRQLHITLRNRPNALKPRAPELAEQPF